MRSSVGGPGGAPNDRIRRSAMGGEKMGLVSVARRLLVPALLVSLAGAAGAQMNRSHQHQDRGTQGVPIDDFVKQLSSPDPAKRLQAVKALGSSKDTKAVEYLIKALADSDVRVRAKAVQVLGDMRATESTQILLQQLVLRTTDSNMKQLIIVSLGKIGDQGAVRPLVELLQQDLRCRNPRHGHLRARRAWITGGARRTGAHRAKRRRSHAAARGKRSQE